MIYEMSQDIAQHLADRFFPVRVVYGPEPYARENYDPIIIFERDRQTGDAVSTVTGNNPNARRVRNRSIGVVCTIFMRSNLEGARVEDHERSCDQLVDAVIVGLTTWATASRAGDIQYTESRYLAASDRNDVETWPGVVYVMRFRVPRGVADLSYTLDGRPTAEIQGFTNRTEVRLTGAPSEVPPATGCGG